MLIQILLSLFIFFALIKIINRFLAKELSFLSLIFWLLFWSAVIIVVWQPNLSTGLANRLGVGRGTDLVMYISVVVLFYLIFRLTVKIEKMERNITKVVRKIALLNKTTDNK